MSLRVPVAFVRRLVLLATAVACLCVAVCTAGAQEQERKLLDRIMHPNMDLHFDGFERTFDTKASNRDRQAAVHPFGFGARSANMKAGDGAFHAKTFNDGRGSFTTGDFAVKPATAVDRQVVPGGDRMFATRSVDVREDRAANKTASNRQFVNAQKPFLVPGKRQDTIDELRQQKNLTVDQIREILNKSR